MSYNKADCKSAGYAFDGSNPSPTTTFSRKGKVAFGQIKRWSCAMRDDFACDLRRAGEITGGLAKTRIDVTRHGGFRPFQ